MDTARAGTLFNLQVRKGHWVGLFYVVCLLAMPRIPSVGALAPSFWRRPQRTFRATSLIPLRASSSRNSDASTANNNKRFLDKHELVQKQTAISRDISSENMETMDQFLQHQAETFDNMAPFFSEKQTIPDTLVPIYETLASKIVTHLEQERDRLPADPEEEEESNPSATRPMRLLDVATGTGALWPFLLEQATQRGMTLHITGVDLSPKMVDCAQEHATHLMALPQFQNQNHQIQVVQSDVMEYSAPLFDAIICNACWGNFYSQRAVLEHLTQILQTDSHASRGPFGTLFITHPLGAEFVKELHESDSRTVPHLLPAQWTHQDLIGIPLQVDDFVTSVNIDSKTFPFYFSALKRVRHFLLPNVWRFRGPVAKGYGRGGKKLGFPTANLVASQFFQDALQNVEAGVYLGWAQIERDAGSKHSVHKAVVNVGFSPTFEGQENPEKIIEAHLMPDTPLEDFYAETMRLELLAFLRPEQKFGSFPDLIAQIQADAEDSTSLLNHHPVLKEARNDDFFSTPDWTGVTSQENDGSSSWESQDMNEYLEQMSS